jgi:glycerol-3-phosphate dehydrogenase
MFAIPWHGHTLVGTTDTPISTASLEPLPLEHEIDFILATAAQYLHKAPTRQDILSAFAGIRPLVRSGGAGNTAALSRDHTIHIDRSGLLTITGGKWTTYRHMAEDCVDQAATLARLPEKPCATAHLNIHGFHKHSEQFHTLAVYGADAPAIQELIESDQSLGKPLHPALTCCGAEVLWAVRFEMARTVEDFLARRTRALFLNARAAVQMARRVAELMAKELERDARWQEEQVRAFQRLAKGYLPDRAGGASELEI